MDISTEIGVAGDAPVTILLHPDQVPTTSSGSSILAYSFGKQYESLFVIFVDAFGVK